VLEKTLESPLDCKEIQPVHSEGDQPWVFFGWNDAIKVLKQQQQQTCQSRTLYLEKLSFRNKERERFPQIYKHLRNLLPLELS